MACTYICLYINYGDRDIFSKKSDTHKECMYWTGDHYEAITCYKKIYGKEIIALDTLMLFHFKKNPDTLTTYSLGKVWYLKKNGKLEFFSAFGHHTIFTDKELKPISAYIINNYCQQLPAENTNGISAGQHLSKD
ncbi:hypothetical protein ACVWYG_001269 [Pedobacter sp. UYEF25]